MCFLTLLFWQDLSFPLQLPSLLSWTYLPVTKGHTSLQLFPVSDAALRTCTLSRSFPLPHLPDLQLPSQILHLLKAFSFFLSLFIYLMRDKEKDTGIHKRVFTPQSALCLSRSWSRAHVHAQRAQAAHGTRLRHRESLRHHCASVAGRGFQRLSLSIGVFVRLSSQLLLPLFYVDFQTSPSLRHQR